MANSEGEIQILLDEANKLSGEFIHVVEQELFNNKCVTKKVDSFAYYIKEIFDLEIDELERLNTLTEDGRTLYNNLCKGLTNVFRKVYGITFNDSDIYGTELEDIYTVYRVIYLNINKFYTDYGVGKILYLYDKYNTYATMTPRLQVPDNRVIDEFISRHEHLNDEDFADILVGKYMLDENDFDLDSIPQMLLRADKGNADYIFVFGEEGSLGEKVNIDFNVFREKITKEFIEHEIDEDYESTKGNITLYFKSIYDIENEKEDDYTF